MTGGMTMVMAIRKLEARIMHLEYCGAAKTPFGLTLLWRKRLNRTGRNCFPIIAADISFAPLQPPGIRCSATNASAPNYLPARGAVTLRVRGLGWRRGLFLRQWV